MQRTRIVWAGRMVWAVMFPLLLLAAFSAGVARAQADAQQAYQQAKAAFEADDFAKARDLAEQAAQTDVDNPEVFLLLGKAHYQLGELDEALDAWQRTLRLAPEEPFARRMLDALQAQRRETELRISLVEAMLQQGLNAAALDECSKLLSNKVLTAAERARIKTLQADGLVRAGQGAQALRVVGELETLYAEQADAVQVALLRGQAELRSGDEAAVRGLSRLKKLLAENPEGPAAVTAQGEVLLFELSQEATAQRADALGTWLDAQEEHFLAPGARKALINACYALSGQTAPPAVDAPLGPWEQKVKQRLERLGTQPGRAEELGELFDRFVKHIDSRYGGRGAWQAAVQAVELKREVPWPAPVVRRALGALARYQTELAMRQLERQAAAGKLPAAAALGELPRELAAVAKVYEAIHSDFPGQPAWAELVALAERVQQLAARVQVVGKVESLKGPDAWAATILLLVVQANADPAAVQKAAAQLQAIGDRYAGLATLEGQQLALQLSRTLLDAPLSPDHAAWPGAIDRHAKLLDACARTVFDENVRSGNDAANAVLSETQQELLATLEKLLARDAALADQALALANAHLQPWVQHKHWKAAEEFYQTLLPALPETSRLNGELAVVNLWVQQAFQEHDRLAAAGLTVPRELDPLLRRALVRLCQLQAGLEPESAQLGQVRGVWDSIVMHYVNLEYDDVAEAAIQVRAEKPVEAANEYAEFRLIVFKEALAQRELARRLAQYGAREEIELSPEFQEVIDQWKKFIGDRPASLLTPQAAERILQIAGYFEQHAAHETAAGIYDDLSQFGAHIKVLAQSTPSAPSLVERAALAHAVALDRHARKLLAEAISTRKEDEPPPAKVSAEFAAAIAAYQGFAARFPDSRLVNEALGKILSVAMEYVKADAWDAADSIYADLLASELKLRRPERLKLALGLCRLGQVMPDHARSVLQELTAGGLRGPASGPAQTALALADGRRSQSFTMGFGGMGGMGRFGGPGGPVKGLERAPQPATPALPPAEPPPTPASEAGADMPAQSGPTGGAASGSVRGAQTADKADMSEPSDEAVRDSQLLAMIRQQEMQQAAQVAQLRENLARYENFAPQIAQGEQAEAQQTVQVQGDQQGLPTPVLSEEELARQEKAIQAAYDIFQAIRRDHPHTPTAQQARGEILVMVTHWREIGQWQRAAALAGLFLKDNPKDGELPKLRLEIARDRLSWAAQPIRGKATRQELLDEVSKRFTAARDELGRVIEDFPKERAYQQQAQWELATSFQTQARVVARFSPTLARGQYVRAARELLQVATRHVDHPRLGEIPQMLWQIGGELEGRGYHEEAILVWSELTIFDPLNDLARQAALKIAQTYHQQLRRPLKAAQAYQEMCFARGGADISLQDAIYQIGTELKNQQRWVEALHVLETFVDSFPNHPRAGEALATVGQIHQANQAWEDAMEAYDRVIAEFEDGPFVQQAKWAIAECRINLSRWSEAMAAYRDYVEAYPQDQQVAEANRRIEVLKDLVRYQSLVDEEGQRKAFDAQYQIAEIVRHQLSNPVKAIIEYRKVVARWPQSHLADDALYEVGTSYVGLGDTEKAREALRQMARQYPSSPLADDALFQVGKSYEDEADKLAGMTREATLQGNIELAQRQAYKEAQSRRRAQEEVLADRIAGLKSAGKGQAAEVAEAFRAANVGQFNEANVRLFVQKAEQEVEVLTASQLADRQDKINAALRRAVEAYTSASRVAGADKADEALLQMATIYDERLKDSEAAMQTWLEIVRQFSGTAVAEDASWRIAQTYERQQKYAEAIKAYESFLRNYRRSPKAGDAQFAIAENYEHLGQWVQAMDAYTNYVNNFPEGPLVQKAKDQINWIKTYRL